MVRSFLIAAQFLTRLPVPKTVVASEDQIRQSVAFFPLIGVFVGGSGALLYAALSPFLPATTCVLAVLVYSALITNAFHEDGFADALDGFGGGWTKEAALTIMRDSRVGTFGALGLVLLVLTKYNLLSALEWQRLWRCLIFAHAASRWTVVPLCLWLPYAREEGQGKLVAHRIDIPTATVGTLTFGAVAALFRWQEAIALVMVTMTVVFASGFYYRRRLNGITGDCLGATNQLTEVAIYLAVVVAAKLP